MTFLRRGPAVPCFTIDPTLGAVDVVGKAPDQAEQVANSGSGGTLPKGRRTCHWKQSFFRPGQVSRDGEGEGTGRSGSILYQTKMTAPLFDRTLCSIAVYRHWHALLDIKNTSQQTNGSVVINTTIRLRHTATLLRFAEVVSSILMAPD